MRKTGFGIVFAMVMEMAVVMAVVMGCGHGRKPGGECCAGLVQLARSCQNGSNF